VDHVDGLAYPLEYCLHLRDELETRRASRPQGLRDAAAYIVVEKVFAAHEPQRDWGVAGTTGYDFMDQAGAVLHNPAGQSALDILWRRVSGRPWEFRSALTEARRRVLGESFGADLERVARSFDALARRVPDYAHLTPAAIKRALRELIIAFPVYRCYGMPGLLPPEDAAILASALERAYRELNAEDYAALDFIAQCLRDTPQSDAIALAAQAAIRFQQLTTPIAAKAIEDTVFYREARLLSRNEVGSDPNVFSLSVDDFHAACSARAQRFPHSLLATATHDHKRGEDVRARLAVLSDDAERWAETVAHWSERNAAHRGSSAGMPAPDGIDELMLYQTLVGAWPLLGMDDAGACTHFQERVAQWWTKALREAKRHTSWVAQNAAYEQACLAFLAALFDTQQDFLAELGGYVDLIAAAGALNGLTQTALRLTTPGVPDLYQGCEFWDFSLVDPDNRRAFDYAPRRAALARDVSLHEALEHWRDGVVKQVLIARLLAHRAAWPAFYASATYQSLPVRGTRAAHVIAFERSSAQGRLICVTTRWALSLAGGTLTKPAMPAAAWLDTVVELPPDLAPLHDVLHGCAPRTCNGAVAIGELLQDFPLAVYFAPA
jgi:(1->4)-alpha-D-glucan 1-alpha-D-glucosylmutase